MRVGFWDSGPTLYLVQGRAKPVLCGLNTQSLSCSIMKKPHTGLDECLGSYSRALEQGTLGPNYSAQLPLSLSLSPSVWNPFILVGNPTQQNSYYTNIILIYDSALLWYDINLSYLKYISDIVTTPRPGLDEIVTIPKNCHKQISTVQQEKPIKDWQNSHTILFLSHFPPFWLKVECPLSLSRGKSSDIVYPFRASTDAAASAFRVCWCFAVHTRELDSGCVGTIYDRIYGYTDIEYTDIRTLHIRIILLLDSYSQEPKNWIVQQSLWMTDYEISL